MNLEHRIGQLLIIGLPGPQLDLMTRSLLQSIQPGGILLNTHNIESGQQVAELTSTIRSLIEVPPIIAVDQEGGRVDRLKEIYSPMPSADLFRASGEASVAARMGEIAAEALRLKTIGLVVAFGARAARTDRLRGALMAASIVVGTGVGLVVDRAWTRAIVGAPGSDPAVAVPLGSGSFLAQRVKAITLTLFRPSYGTGLGAIGLIAAMGLLFLGLYGAMRGLAG